MSRDRERWRRCRLWLVLILGLAMPAAAVAQAPEEYDEEAEEYGGTLHLRFDRSGEAELSVWAAGNEESPESPRAAPARLALQDRALCGERRGG